MLHCDHRIFGGGQQCVYQTNVACDSHEQSQAFRLVQRNTSDAGIEIKSVQVHDATTQRDTMLSPASYCELGFNWYMYV